MLCNAGMVSDQNILDLQLSKFDCLMALNVQDVVACVKHAARSVVKGRVGGSIVCAGSVGRDCGGGRTNYRMLKHAVVGLVRSASVLSGAHGIRANCISPCAVATQLTSGMALKGKGGR
ncbi:hypothetical protein ACJRO7_008531 [Eucalyptus globulus]|uniref:Uncharacterized protein n=1 Tax=Eucalyptus globulus TaxID=34317 RepID=A0ABD3IRU7_EUCGL